MGFPPVAACGGVGSSECVDLGWRVECLPYPRRWGGFDGVALLAAVSFSFYHLSTV
ncbi:hypothetical protein Bca101_029483 [Brassica carinata]